MKLKNFFRIFLPLILGGIIGFIINGYIDYGELIKPPFAPPKILFPIAEKVHSLIICAGFTRNGLKMVQEECTMTE